MFRFDVFQNVRYIQTYCMELTFEAPPGFMMRGNSGNEAQNHIETDCHIQYSISPIIRG